MQAGWGWGGALGHQALPPPPQLTQQPNQAVPLPSTQPLLCQVQRAQQLPALQLTLSPVLQLTQPQLFWRQGSGAHSAVPAAAGPHLPLPALLAG